MRRSLMRRVRALGTFCSGHAFDYIGDRAIFVEPQSDSISQLSELAYLLLILQNAVGRCLVGNFQPPRSMPPSGAWKSVEFRRVSKKFRQSNGATSLRVATTSSLVMIVPSVLL